MFEWQQEYELGIEIIDKQHQMFVEILNKLYNSILEMKTKRTISQLLKELVQYKKFHFKTEEKYFKRFKYAGAPEHIKEHKKLASQVEVFMERYKKGGDIIQELLDFLEDWLINHLQTQDKKYVKCFHDHGLY